MLIIVDFIYASGESSEMIVLYIINYLIIFTQNITKIPQSLHTNPQISK